MLGKTQQGWPRSQAVACRAMTVRVIGGRVGRILAAERVWVRRCAWWSLRGRRGEGGEVDAAAQRDVGATPRGAGARAPATRRTPTRGPESARKRTASSRSRSHRGRIETSKKGFAEAWPESTRNWSRTAKVSPTRRHTPLSSWLDVVQCTIIQIRLILITIHITC